MPLALALLATALAPLQLEDQLLPQVPFNSRHFGASLALADGLAAVGLPYEGTHNVGFGAVEVQRAALPGWTFDQLIESPDNLDRFFGAAVALEGDLLAIGAPYADRSVLEAGLGAVYVFRESAGTWTFAERVETLAAIGFGYGFGSHVDLEGNLLAVGAADSSRCFVFESGPGGYAELVELAPPSAGSGQRFGQRVALAGDRLAVSAPGAGPGRVHVYVRSGGTYQLEATVEASGGMPGDRFGADVQFDGSSLTVGATHWAGVGRPARTGAVYTFARSGSTWVETDRLEAPPSPYAQEFGSSLARRGDRLLVGAPATTLLPATFVAAGAVHQYEWTGGTWAAVQRYVAPDAAIGDRFGQALGFDGQRALVGAPDCDGAAVDGGAGYALWPSSTSFGQCTAPLACGNHYAAGGCTNSTGVGAHLYGRGSTSIAADELTFRVVGLPPNAPALLFMGGGALNAPYAPLFGGLLCIGSGGVGLFRFPVRDSGAAGSIVEGPGLAAWSQSLPSAGHFLPGDTWFVQCFYRDLLGGVGSCGVGANLSDALRVELIP